MDLQVVRLLFDFGLFVLIWIVQLVVYPGFRYYTKENLITWHQKYTLRITCVVMPLMLGQLLLSGFQLWREVSFYTVISFIVVSLLWASTFLQFIPMHVSIDRSDFNDKTLSDLVRKNWGRTFLWTLLLILSLREMMV